MIRTDGRKAHQVRTFSLRRSPYGYSDGAVLFSLGATTVLVTVTLQDRVPVFMRGGGVGWLTAEYAMLPSATRERTARESSSHTRQGRSVEISRIVGRVMRSVINLAPLGEQTIIIDCDVLHADGGTRTAAITAASYALLEAQKVWLAQKKIKAPLILEPIAALSSGIVAGEPCVDLTQQEDTAAAADFNFVMTRSGDLVEVQGTAERQPLPWQTFLTLKEMTCEALIPLFSLTFE